MNNVNKENIEERPLMVTTREYYFSYAFSIIMSRSLPDVRDGLKPVHRRLLYAMLQLKLDPKGGYKKCARIVGDVIGKYHPHGDTAVYETLVRLAQDFSVRYTLVEGQGNFGSIDGDNAAAMRYTEAKLTNTAMYLLNDIDKDTVDFKPTYDGNEIEPILLPASFPNLLANGSEGIAVGMATSIPPHNISELISALFELIKNPQIEIKDLMKHIPGPDFPTGGVIVENPENIQAAYETGRGSIRLRANWIREDLPYGLYHIIITEIPYQIQKSKLIEKIADLYKEKKLPLLGNIRDESSEEVRIILEPKAKNIDPEILMESLFKTTALEVRVNINMNVISNSSIPGVMNLKQILQSFLDYRYVIVIRRSKYRLSQVEARLNIVSGLLIAYLNLDEIINIIREEDNADEILKIKFELNDLQVEAILNIKLRSLRKLEEAELKKEYDKLISEKKELEKIIKDKGWLVVEKELREVQKIFENNHRRTKFGIAPTNSQEILAEALIEKEPITIICSTLGWVKSYRGHNIDKSEVKYKETDSERFVIEAYNTDKLIIFASNGRFYTIHCDKIAKGKGQGDSIRLLIDLEDNASIIDMFISKNARKFLIASENGKGFIVDESEIIAQTKTGKQILNLVKDDKAMFVKEVEGDKIAIIGTNRKMIIYNIDEIPNMKKGQGVTLQKYRHAVLSDIKFFKFEAGLSWSYGKEGRMKVEKDLLTWIGKRGGVGRLAPTGFSKNNKF